MRINQSHTLEAAAIRRMANVYRCSEDNRAKQEETIRMWNGAERKRGRTMVGGDGLGRKKKKEAKKKEGKKKAAR